MDLTPAPRGTGPGEAPDERLPDHPSLTIERMSSADRGAAVDVVARGMVDNPLHVAAYGPDPHQRLVAHRRLVRGALDVMEALDVMVLKAEGQVLGVAGMAAPGHCQPTSRQRLQLLPVLASLRPRAARRVGRWLAEWARYDPRVEHTHVGPVAIHPDLQGRGLGTLLMATVCAELDRAGTTGYLETDKAENVPFYERFGFEVMGSAVVIGVDNWFMRRSSPGRGVTHAKENE